jgi:type II secretory pathway component GspD/PulD (secretin)
MLLNKSAILIAMILAFNCYSQNDSIKKKENFTIFGHNSIFRNISVKSLEISKNKEALKDSIIPTKHKHVLKRYNGLYEVNLNKKPLIEFYNEMAYLSNLNFSVIGDLNPIGKAALDSYSKEFVIDEVSYQNGVIATKELDRYILYANGAEKILQDKSIIYHYKPRNSTLKDLENNLSSIKLDASITPIATFNEILIKGTLREIKEAISTIRLLDREVGQVSIELLVVEYSHGDNFQWSFDVTSGSVGRISDGNYNPGNGSVNGTYNFLSQLKPNFKVNLQALVEENFANIVTNPHIIATNNEEAEISIKESKFIRLQNAGLNGISTNIQSIDVSLDLKITPNILSDQLVVLNLHANNSEFKPTSTQDNIETTANTIDTKVTVRNGETLILGGLIKAEETNSKGGVPFLRRIPLLGALFRKDLKIKNYKETVIYITTYMDPIKKNNKLLDEKIELQKELNQKALKLEKKGIKKRM